MITSTSLLNPKFAKRIKRALWLAKLQSMKTGKRCTEYVKNRNGRNVIRLDVYSDGSMAAYASGRGSKDMSAVILKALEA
jgi:hypothetical protein